jgi:hypothetical protein
MASIVEVDCGTGKATVRSMTAEEASAHQQLQDAVKKNAKARQDDDTARDGVLAQIATKLGVDVDDLKGALRLGPGKQKKA